MSQNFPPFFPFFPNLNLNEWSDRKMWKPIFKIMEVRDGFSVWRRKNFGNGFAYEDTGRKFKTLEEALKYIEKEKESDNK